MSYPNFLNILIFSGVMLAVCGAIVFRWRIQHRFKKLQNEKGNTSIRKSYAPESQL